MICSFLCSVRCIEKAALDGEMWMNANLLKLNADKTKVLIFGSRQRLLKVDIPYIKVGEVDILPVKGARNIGAFLDENLTYKKHIDNMCKSAWYHLNSIRNIRKYLTTEVTTIVIHAFVTA